LLDLSREGRVVVRARPVLPVAPTMRIAGVMVVFDVGCLVYSCEV
jgi:hypothetical protein